ncbi:MAG: hypothetical protein J0I09_04895 [Sphingobacteriia bacterium]|nr:hypothetical protein [Sphingobacteriia bacterium]
MKKNFKKFIPLFVLLFIGLAALCIWLVMWLWNNVLAEAVSGIHIIGFWQAAGIFLLAKILFGGFKKGWRKNDCYPDKKHKWFNMSEEDKEKFKQEWRNKWCKPSAEKSNQAGTE